MNTPNRMLIFAVDRLAHDLQRRVKRQRAFNIHQSQKCFEFFFNHRRPRPEYWRLVVVEYFNRIKKAKQMKDFALARFYINKLKIAIPMATQIP